MDVVLPGAEDRAAIAVAQLSQIAGNLADDLRTPGSFHVLKVATALSGFLREIADADVAYCRQVEPDGSLQLVSEPIWAEGVEPVGVVPGNKHLDDGPCELDCTSGGDRKPEYNASADQRGKYEAREMEFMRWLKSEAWVPVIINDATRAVVLLGKGTQGHFAPERIEQLRQYQDFVRAFYHLADLCEDRFHKTELLKDMAAVLPRIAAATRVEQFQRAICTLLTCEYGFRFDRALLFWMNNRRYPAECKMAVGGMGQNWWEKQSQIRACFRGLREYVEDSLQFPFPGRGKCKLEDPLYVEMCAKPLLFREWDEGAIRDLVANRFAPAETVRKLSASDPWIGQIRQNRPAIFCSPWDEYFLFPLMAFDGEELLGFVIADLAYRPQRHTPGPGFPDLEMVALVLRLISQMWLSREDSQSYFHVLAALPTLRHAAPSLGASVGGLQEDIRNRADWSLIQDEIEEVAAKTRELERAAEIVEGMKERELSSWVEDVEASVLAFCRWEQERHAPLLKCSCNRIAYRGPVRIPPHILETILDIIVDNAVCSSRGAGREGLNLTLEVSLLELPEYEGNREPRVLLTLENDGPGISPDLAPYLFVDRVSTHESEAPHRGTGLSCARLQAKAYNGEVVLLSNDPVRFGVVLEPYTPPKT